MRKIITLFAILLLGVAVSAQSFNQLVTITADTLTKVETEYFTLQPITSTVKSIAIQAAYTDAGGSPDGTILLQGSLDGTSYQTLNSGASNIDWFPNDSIDITDSTEIVWLIEIANPAFRYYRIAATGTADDTTLIAPKYFIKK